MPPFPTRPTAGRRPMTRQPAAAASYDGEDDRPARRAPQKSDTARAAVRERRDAVDMGGDGLIKIGREGAREIRNSLPSDFAPRLELAEDPIIIKFLEREGISWKQHWTEWVPKGTKKSYVCLDETRDAGNCPLCAIGDRPSFRAAYNVISFADPQSPTLCVYYVGQRDDRRLEVLDGGERPKSGPLDDPNLYYSVSQAKGTNGKGAAVTTITHVKAKDLEDDWGITPFDEDEIEEFMAKLYTQRQIVHVSAAAELQAVADMSD